MNDIWLGVSGGKPNPDALLASGEIGASRGRDEAGAVDVDRLKATERMDAPQIDALRTQRPLLLHLGIGVIWPRRKRWATGLARLAQHAKTPWLSVHLDLGWTFLAYHWPGPTPIPRALARRWAVRSVQRLQEVCEASVPGHPPVLVENMPRWSRSRPAYTADPAFISAVVEESGCGFLLDLAHARVAAAYQGEPERDYLARLPLERLVEIHVSGPRPAPGGGPLTDAHQPMLKADYALLAWVLERWRPRAVTLEYSKDRAQIVAQLVRLREMIEGG